MSRSLLVWFVDGVGICVVGWGLHRLWLKLAWYRVWRRFDREGGLREIVASRSFEVWLWTIPDSIGYWMPDPAKRGRWRCVLSEAHFRRYGVPDRAPGYTTKKAMSWIRWEALHPARRPFRPLRTPALEVDPQAW